MSTTDLITKELAALPEIQQRKVYEFAQALRRKENTDSFNGLLLSESVLARDWNTPAEDAAWANL